MLLWFSVPFFSFPPPASHHVKMTSIHAISPFYPPPLSCPVNSFGSPTDDRAAAQACAALDSSLGSKPLDPSILCERIPPDSPRASDLPPSPHSFPLEAVLQQASPCPNLGLGSHLQSEIQARGSLKTTFSILIIQLPLPDSQWDPHGIGPCVPHR